MRNKIALHAVLALLISLGVIMPDLTSAAEASNSSRLAISILASRATDTCQGPLNASLQLFAQNLMPFTPSDLFVFTVAKNAEFMKACVNGLGIKNPHIFVISIPEEDWSIPHHVRNESLWRNPIGWEYRYVDNTVSVFQINLL